MEVQLELKLGILSCLTGSDLVPEDKGIRAQGKKRRFYVQESV